MRSLRDFSHPLPIPPPLRWGGAICLADLAQQADHFDGDLCRFRAFVTGFGASALYGLFDAVGGEHAVDDRDVVAERNVAQGFGAFADDVVQVGGTLMRVIPRSHVAATKPAMSVVAPPPRAMMAS